MDWYDPKRMRTVQLIEPVARFAEHMQRRLVANAHKGGPEDWRNARLRFLHAKLDEEVAEVRACCAEMPTAPAVPGHVPYTSHLWDEAADVGNVVMMVADACEAQRGARW